MNLIKIFRPFAIWQIPQIEKWLKIQAESGLKLVDYKNCKFIFAKCPEKTREYFVYISPAFQRRDDFLEEFHFLKKLYSKGKSNLNKAKRSISEVDLRKIDNNYALYRLSRNSHYQKYYVTMLIISTILCVAFFPPVLLKNTAALPFSLVCLIPMIHSVISIVALKHQKHILRKNLHNTSIFK